MQAFASRFVSCRLVAIAAALLAATANLTAGQALPLDEQTPWPRVRSTNGNTVTVHLPQVERWTSNWFRARAAVEVKSSKEKKELFGVVWFEARGGVDHSNRLVTLDSFEITKAKFPEASDQGSNALAIVRDVLPSGARTVSLDYLVTALGFAQAAARHGASGLKHEPPNIIWVTNRTVLILVDGDPVLRPITGSTLQRVINSPAMLVNDPAAGKLFLAGEGHWFSADSIAGPWSLVQTPPPAVASLLSTPGGASDTQPDEEAPRIIVSSRPAELLRTLGLPDFRPIPGTALQYAADSESQLFFYSTAREAYLLLSGRWFKAGSLRGPWTYVAPHDLPADFARIPPGSPQAVVLASVPDTPQADLAILANSVPTSATVDRREATTQVEYDGVPNFQPIEGTPLRYAVNAQLPVILTGSTYYALDNGVWFVAAAPTGPWQTASEVPDEIYTIPPSSPVYYATFARIYQADEDEVEVGYTPGYTGAYEDDGTIVYGTGWNYQPWYGDYYYGWGWTWGYGYAYVPWYQWWVWRPWWNDFGGLRSAVIDNIYDRWQAGNGVTPYGSAPSAARAPSAPSAPSADRAQSAGSAPSADRAPSAERALSAERAQSAERAASAARAPSAERAASAGFAGYPALYGRSRGSSGSAAWTPPRNTVALNPYARPTTTIHAGEIPNGAQLLSSLRQTPGGGRDLYASPDGNIYRRNKDAWYRREAGGGWSFFAPTQGRLERNGVASAQGAQAGAGVYRPVQNTGAARARAQAARARMPDSGVRARAQDVADLERQYYARSLAQIRAQNWRASGNISRPARAAGRRR